MWAWISRVLDFKCDALSLMHFLISDARESLKRSYYEGVDIFHIQ